MKLLIAADMEGITGVVDGTQVDSKHPEYARFRHLMTMDINAAIRGASAAGVDEILVTDGHGPKTNILIEELDARAHLHSGTGPLSMVQGIDSGVTAAFFIGYHARSGTLHAVLCHTVSGRVISNVWLNDRLVGEIGMNAALCGSFGVPVLLISGDLAARQEAEREIPGIKTAVTKQASDRAAADCLPPEVTHARIESLARQAVQDFLSGQAPAPVQVETPARFTTEYFNPGMADHASLLPGSERLDGCRVAHFSGSLPVAYQAFRAAMVLASS